jgi:hypothetical protein
MALNPIVFTEKVVRSFLRYQLTTYPFTDERLHGQMRRLLSLDESRNSPLLKGPFISLSRPFRAGAPVEDLVKDGALHPLMRQRIPDEITHLYGHQEKAIRAIRSGRTTLISTGTGSGKTEWFKLTEYELKITRELIKTHSEYVALWRKHQKLEKEYKIVVNNYWQLMKRFNMFYEIVMSSKLNWSKKFELFVKSLLKIYGF